MLTHRFATILGDIPADWDTDLLCNLILEHKAGDWGDDTGEVAVNVLRSTNFKARGTMDFEDVAIRYFNTRDAVKMGLKEKDLLLERSGGGPTQPVGRMGFITKDLPNHWFSNFVQLLRPDFMKIDPQFLGWVLLELNRSGVVERLQHQTTQMRNLDFRDYLRVYVPKPKTEEQIAIALVLQMVNESLAAAEAKLNASRRVKTALMQQCFTHGIPGRHSHFKLSKLGEIPDSWDVLKLKKCGEWGSGGTPDRDNKEFWGGTIPWVKSGEVGYRLITDTEERITEVGAASINGELLPPGTLLVAMYGAGVTRGKSALLGVTAYINQAIAFFKGNEQTDNEWLLYWFEQNYEQVRAFAGGANQDNLSLYLLKNLEIARPRRDEQLLIVSILKEASAAISAAEAVVSSLELLRRSMLQNLLTGKVRVRN